MTVHFVPSFLRLSKLHIWVNAAMRTVACFYSDWEKTTSLIFKFRQCVLSNGYLNSPFICPINIFIYCHWPLWNHSGVINVLKEWMLNNLHKTNITTTFQFHLCGNAIKMHKAMLQFSDSALIRAEQHKDGGWLVVLHIVCLLRSSLLSS